MVTPRTSHTATLLRDGKVLVAGGISTDVVSQAELYDPSSGSWAATGGMIEPRYNHTATLLLDGRVLLAGGSTSSSHGGSLASGELYDPASETWTPTAEMVAARFGHTANLLPDGTVLAAGGFGDAETTPTDSGALLSAERYDPRSGAWAATGSMAEGRGKHTATLLLDGTVLATRLGRLGSAERYDPDSGSWAATGNMDIVRFVHTATLLPDGRVLVTGGSVDGDATGQSAELYDPSSGSWTATANMLTPHQDHTATLLPDGTVLVAGGSLVARGELYDPGSGPEIPRPAQS